MRDALPQPIEHAVEPARDALGLPVRGYAGEIAAQHRGVEHVAIRAQRRLLGVSRVEPERGSFAAPIGLNRRVPLVGNVEVDPDQLTDPILEPDQLDRGVLRAEYAANTARQLARQEREDLAELAAIAALAEPVDREHEMRAARRELAGREPIEQGAEPGLRARVRIAQEWVALLDLARQGARDRRWLYAIELLALHEVMGDELARRTAPTEPVREDRGLAGTGRAGQHDPTIDAVSDKLSIKLGENGVSSDELTIWLRDRFLHTPSGKRHPHLSYLSMEHQGSCGKLTFRSACWLLLIALCNACDRSRVRVMSAQRRWQLLALPELARRARAAVGSISPAVSGALRRENMRSPIQYVE